MKAVFIAWQDPESRRWVPVGRLTAKGTVFQFVYTQGAMSFPNFRAFGAMSDLHSSYESSTLFPLFSNRLLSKSRPEYHDYLRWLDVKTEISDPLDELAKTGGIRATDLLIVFPCPEPQEDGRYSISFFGHGIRYLPHESQQWVERLEPGRRLYLMLDNQNEQDTLAIAMRTEPVMVVGYVPRYFAEDFRKIMDSKIADTIHVQVDKVNHDAPIQMRLLCTLKSVWPEGFAPCSGDLYTPLA